MPAQIDIEKDNTRFFLIFSRVLLVCAILVGILLTVQTYAILKNHAVYLHDWRGAACIVLAAIAFLLYALPTLTIFRRTRDHWPFPLAYTIGLWGALYLTVMLLTLIDRNFLWAFYVVFASSFSLFKRRYVILTVSVAALTMFAFQDLLSWPLSGEALVGIISQILTISSLTGFSMVLQHLIEERFKRNELLRQLAHANAELEEAHTRLAQSAAQEQELAVLRERTRLAREMHDTIGHALVLISVKLEAAQRLRERDPERCDRELESTKEIARGTMTALRASIANLRSPALEREHIYHALSRSAGELAQRTGLHVTCDTLAQTTPLSEPLSETLWKVSQEAFTNIEKHAHAKNVHVEISRRDEMLLMRIHDDGVGLPPAFCDPQKNHPHQEQGHYGLRGMLERVEAIGGHLTLHSQPGQGTTIEVELPLPTSDQPTPLESFQKVEKQREEEEREPVKFRQERPIWASQP
ncbi:MAG: sensor histidine kinase [Ktedonobacteraceae bacterium]|nr:sensor histidine kinase [Ktedonobacteraceae bacterium]